MKTDDRRRKNRKNSKKETEGSSPKYHKIVDAVEQVERIGRTIGNKIDSDFNLRINSSSFDLSYPRGIIKNGPSLVSFFIIIAVLISINVVNDLYYQTKTGDKNPQIQKNIYK